MTMLKRLFQMLGSREKPLRLTAFSMTGRRTRQEDAFWHSDPAQGPLLVVVADGVGGHPKGDFASQETVGAFRARFRDGFEKGHQVEAFFKECLFAAADNVLRKAAADPDFAKTGSTATGFWVDQDHFMAFNVGDSRVYLLDQDAVVRVTKDHSLVQRLIDQGQITETEARIHPQRSIMTSAIGQPIHLMQVDVLGPLPIRPGQILLACSDGLSDFLTDNEIHQFTNELAQEPNLAEALVKMAFDMGSLDNITAVVYRH